MKVILKQDVANVGLKNEIKDVANGYAQNFLIGRGLAELATPAKMKLAEKQAAQREAQKEAARAALESAIGKLKNKPLVIHATANEQEHLFEAVSTETIAAHLKDVLGVDVETTALVIDAPIKTLGEHTIHIAIDDSKVPVQLKIENN